VLSQSIDIGKFTIIAIESDSIEGVAPCLATPVPKKVALPLSKTAENLVNPIAAVIVNVVAETVFVKTLEDDMIIYFFIDNLLFKSMKDAIPKNPKTTTITPIE
jgi:hypothetical protein